MFTVATLWVIAKPVHPHKFWFLSLLFIFRLDSIFWLYNSVGHRTFVLGSICFQKKDLFKKGSLFSAVWAFSRARLPASQKVTLLEASLIRASCVQYINKSWRSTLTPYFYHLLSYWYCEFAVFDATTLESQKHRVLIHLQLLSRRVSLCSRTLRFYRIFLHLSMFVVKNFSCFWQIDSSPQCVQVRYGWNISPRSLYT